MTKSFSGADALVGELSAHGVDTLFSVPGAQLDHLFCALHKQSDKIRTIHFRHEQGAAYAALGYAQSSGRVGTYAVVPGPGILNTTAALSTAHATGAAVLAISGQLESRFIDRGLGELHEIPGQSGILGKLTKWNALITQTNGIASAVAEAFRQIKSGRVRPVALEIPPDVLGQPMEAGEREPGHPVLGRTNLPARERLQAAAQLLVGSKAPIIVAGGGALEAAAPLLRIAEMLQAPVASYRQGRTILPTSSPFSFNLHEAAKRWADSDVILAVGTRLHTVRKLWGIRPHQKLIHIDVDRLQMLAGGKPDIELVGDGAETLAVLADMISSMNESRPSIVADLCIIKEESNKEFKSALAPQMAYIKALEQGLPDDAIFVADYTQIGYVATAKLATSYPRQLLTPGYQGTLGFGYATALGAKVAHPDRQVVALCGDGGFLFTAMEMATAVQHGINVIAVVFNDNAFTNVRRMQRKLYGGRMIATDLKNPDFVKMAESFGVTATRVTDPSGLRAALARAVAAKTPALIEVMIAAEMPDPWPMLGPALR